MYSDCFGWAGQHSAIAAELTWLTWHVGKTFAFKIGDFWW